MASPEEQLGQILALLGENSKGINELKNSMTEMRALRTEINAWKPEVDNCIHDLEHAVVDLGERVDRVLGMLLPQAKPMLEGLVTVTSAPSAPREDLSASPSTKVLDSGHLESSSKRAASGSLDHGTGSTHRGADFKAVYTITPETTSVTGATHLPKSCPILFPKDDYVHHDWCYYPPTVTPFPDVEFQKFDGSNSHFWVKRCETYFDVYQTDPSLWVCLASMCLTGSAALWFQAMQSTIGSMTKDSFVTAICNRFDRDEHNHLLRQFFHIKQLSTVSNMLNTLVT